MTIQNAERIFCERVRVDASPADDLFVLDCMAHTIREFIAKLGADFERLDIARDYEIAPGRYREGRFHGEFLADVIVEHLNISKEAAGVLLARLGSE